ncbi:methylated-DNA--[protein]-cysteine S-methyltransferase [Hymenobacter guriensis]|uniref:Methylated-DNA--protein-cysteine methyltransferase n=1 Tax=Hymenobacter guriensis TaxID=2793065 RepID=A0ABS0L4Q6_9BACT|nr:methylated-DNA--[protein]-cysteine S-methyltransferase [Hymenobacter guriensis]MBG8555143.1 methylated-DNA--[protein]-cysteine S-methyltransferase [Hymenobacter guriensis]
MTTIACASLASPAGLLELRGSDAGLLAVEFVRLPTEPAASTPPGAVASCLKPAYEQLRAYFGRELRDFQLTYDPSLGTEFQRQVWQQLTYIPYGQTVSYLTVAHRLGNPQAVRAVGAANGQNPLAIVVPCHRVIGANGRLTGYAGGLGRKKWLLDFEQPPRQTTLF